MQVFNVSTGKYLCHNKYFGRGLTPAGFKDAIAQFLNNSDPLASEQVNLLSSLPIYPVINLNLMKLNKLCFLSL
jgi:hypothetical protein